MPPPLESLRFSDTNITIKGLEILLNKFSWPNLKKLDISCNKIGDKGLEILASARLPLLEFLNLASIEILPKGLEILVKQSNWPNLKQLDVSWNKIGDKGLEILTLVKWPKLELLNLSSTEITAHGIEILVSKSNWPNLKQLDLSKNEIREEGLKALSYGKWPLLEGLYLKNVNSFGGAFGDFESLFRISKWPNLRLLDISYNSRISFENLAEGEWKMLEVLNLKKTAMTLKRIETFVKNSSLPSLERIDLSENPIKNSERDAVRKLLFQRWSRLEIIFKN